MGTPWIAASGLALVLFLLVHLAGVAVALVDGQLFERYAASLHGLPWLPLLEAALAAFLLAHPSLSLARAIANARARGPVGFLQRTRREGASEGLAAFAGRSLPISGVLMLLFLVVHLAQLRLHRPPAGGELAAMLLALASPWSLALYVLAGMALALHLFHGHESAHRSLGLLDSANAGSIRLAGRSLALLLGGGFALLPLALLWRFSGSG